MGQIQDELKRINARLDEDDLKKKKRKEKLPRKFKIPFSKRVNPTMAKKNFVTVMRVNENGFLKFERKEIVDQTIIVDGIPRLATPEFVLHHKKNPVIIQPNWDVKPYSPEAAVSKSLDNGSNTTGYKILMARMKSDNLGRKAPVGGMVKIIGGLIFAAIIGYALLTGGG